MIEGCFSFFAPKILVASFFKCCMVVEGTSDAGTASSFCLFQDFDALNFLRPPHPLPHLPPPVLYFPESVQARVPLVVEDYSFSLSLLHIFLFCLSLQRGTFRFLFLRIRIRPVASNLR